MGSAPQNIDIKTGLYQGAGWMLLHLLMLMIIGRSSYLPLATPVLLCLTSFSLHAVVGGWNITHGACEGAGS